MCIGVGNTDIRLLYCVLVCTPPSPLGFDHIAPAHENMTRIGRGIDKCKLLLLT